MAVDDDGEVWGSRSIIPIMSGPIEPEMLLRPAKTYDNDHGGEVGESSSDGGFSKPSFCDA